MEQAPRLDGIVLVDARGGRSVDLGREPAFGIITLIRHRF